VRLKQDKGSGHLVRNILLAALLAVLCIGGAELAACRHFAPETYDRIVAPVRWAASAAVDMGRSALDAAGAFFRAAGDQAVKFAGWTSRQLSALWEGLTGGAEEAELPPDPPPSQPPATEPPVTQVMQVGGRQILTGGMTDVVYFCQSDPEWADQPYGTDPIGPYGCGPTAMAMAVATLTDEDTDPAKMAAWAAEHGYWARRSGSYDSIVMGTAQGFGLEAESLTQRTVDEMLQALWDGKLLVAHVGSGHFTDGGHFILIRGATLTGEVLVADPNSLERSLELWDPQLILDELSSARDHGAPLWSLSVSDT